MKCSICNLNEADQTGAHIFPAWMIASAFDHKSRTRGYEIIYAKYPLDSKLPFFGNSVSIDQIKDQIGRDLTNEEILNQKNMFTVDNLWCRKCERRLKQVEDYFLETVERKINDFSNCNDTDRIELNNSNNYLIRLFLYSIIYRASLVRFMGFTLNYKSAKKLNFFLNNYIKDDLQSTLSFISSSYRKDQLLKYPIRCIKTEQEANSAGLVFVHNKHNKPYCLIINRYIIQFYGKGNQANFKPNSFFGISSIIKEAPEFKNYKEEVFRIGLINQKLWNNVMSSLFNSQVSYIMRNHIRRFELMHKLKFGYMPDKTLITLFIKELIDNDLPLGIKYTKEKIVEAMNRAIK